MNNDIIERGKRNLFSQQLEISLKFEQLSKIQLEGSRIFWKAT